MPRSPTTSKTARPRPQTTNSFPRIDQTKDDDGESRPRSSTVNSSSITIVTGVKEMVRSTEEATARQGSDAFVSTPSHEASEEQANSLADHMHTLDQLPIEIRSLTERFLKSLSVKSHATPLRIDAISELFQDFYVQAESHISTHIAALTTRLSRENSPASSSFARRTVSARASQDSLADQQLLTASELADRRKARRRLELQRTALEEEVERSVCDKVYDKIYRHRSTDDEEKDAKLRSKTAALSLVGVGLKELHVNIPESNNEDDKNLEQTISQQLAPAREHLQRMDEARYPLGKLQSLTAAHQSIVETLAKIFPSTSSADEVLPTLIYTLVTSPPETLNVASNLHFIQLFRANAKIDGEAAYCLVNLEAAISFLETVDLSSLRADDGSQNTGLSAHTSEHNTSEALSLTANLPGVSNPKQTVKDGKPTAVLQSPQQAAGAQQRNLAQLLQSQAGRLEAGKETLMNSADTALESINSTLDSSFKFLFGRLREQSAESPRAEVVIPKTLDEARRLVSSPVSEEDDEEGVLSGHASLAGLLQEDPLSRAPDRALSIIAGKRASREASVDSMRSGSSFHRAGPAGGVPESRLATSGPAEAVGNFVNALNPLSRFAVGVPSFARFGRSPSGPLTGNTPSEKSPTTTAFREDGRRNSNHGLADETSVNELEGIAQLRRAKPPLQKFMKVQSSRELRLGDVEELLKDYQRLAALVVDAKNE